MADVHYSCASGRWTDCLFSFPPKWIRSIHIRARASCKASIQCLQDGSSGFRQNRGWAARFVQPLGWLCGITRFEPATHAGYQKPTVSTACTLNQPSSHGPRQVKHCSQKRVPQCYGVKLRAQARRSVTSQVLSAALNRFLGRTKSISLDEIWSRSLSKTLYIRTDYMAFRSYSHVYLSVAEINE